MPTLYVTEPGAVVRRQKNSIIVTLRENSENSGNRSTTSKILLEVEPHRVELIALIGHIHITSDVTDMYLKNGIAIFWITRSGDFLGRLVPELSRTATIRYNQFNIAVNVEESLSIGRLIILGKHKNTVSLLTAIRSNRTNEKSFTKVISHIDSLLPKLKSA